MRLFPTLPDTPPHSLLASVLPLLAPMATMGMTTVSSHADLTSHSDLPPLPDLYATTSSPPKSATSAGPTLIFGSTLRSCAFCLEDYRAGDRLRLLDACGHCFHATCVDTWLDNPHASVHSSFACPVCKTPVSMRPDNSKRMHRRGRVQSDLDDGLHEEPGSRDESTETGDDSVTTPPWANVQLIDLSVHQSWVEWFSELVRLYSVSDVRWTRRSR